MKSVNDAKQRRIEARSRLRYLLRRRLFDDVMSFFTAHSIRSLADTIQQEIRSPVINDVMIAEVIRSLAFEVEENYRGDVKKRLLEKLNDVYREIAPRKSALLSIASTDPLAAYRLSWPGNFLIFFLVAIALIQLFQNWMFLEVIFWIIFILGLALILSTIRTRNYWKSSKIEDKRRRSIFASLLSPKKLNPVFDVLSFITITPSKPYLGKWSALWPALWEEVYFMFMKPRFLEMHEYRYFDAQPLIARLVKLHNNMLRLQQKGQQLPETDLDEYLSLCRELWAITGEERYKTLMQKAREGVLWDIDLYSYFEARPFGRKEVELHTNTLRNNILRLHGGGDILLEYLTNKKFMSFYRYLKARPFRGRLVKLHNNMLRLQQKGQQLPETDLDEYLSLCRELWAITGEEGYKTLMQKAREGVLWDIDPIKKNMNQMARFKRLQRDFLLYKLGKKSMQVSDIKEYMLLCKHLEEMTGLGRYRDYEKEAQEAVERLIVEA